MARLLYLGEYLRASPIVACLTRSNKFERIDHLTKVTLNTLHVSMNPLPDAIVCKCDWEDSELEWLKRYSKEIPRIILVCDLCKHKLVVYEGLGTVYMLEEAYAQHDFNLDSLIKAIEEIIS